MQTADVLTTPKLSQARKQESKAEGNSQTTRKGCSTKCKEGENTETERGPNIIRQTQRETRTKTGLLETVQEERETGQFIASHVQSLND